MSPRDSSAGQVLFIDDDIDVLQAGALALRRHGFEVHTLLGPDDIWNALSERQPDVILLDLNFSPGARSGAEGLQILQRLVAYDPDAVVLVVTGHSGVAIAVSAMRAGAADFIMKPWSNDRLASTVADAVALRRRRRKRAARPSELDTFVLGRSPVIDRLRARIVRLAAAEPWVLIHGEPGVGKARVARAIHAASGQRDRPLQVLDLAATEPGDQVEQLNQISAGTLLLKSAETLARDGFSALTRMTVSNPEVRILATATCPEDLSRWPDRLRFHLSGTQLLVPPLRSRRGDILDLTQHFVRRTAVISGDLPKSVSPDAEAWLSAADWPGNVRELRAVVEQAILLSEDDVINLGDVARLEAVGPQSSLDGRDDLNLERQERRLVEAALKRHGFNVSHAAHDLGLTRAALYRRMDKHGL